MANFMNKALIGKAVLAVVFLGAGQVFAQSGSSNAGGGGAIGGGAGGGGGAGISSDGSIGLGSSNTALTAGESILKGQAEFIRSVGQGRLDSSEALINVEVARKKAIQNRRLASEVHNDVIRQSIERNRLRREFYASRYEQTARTVSLSSPAPGSSTVPARLASHQIYGDEHGIAWPNVLRDARFAAERSELEKLFDMKLMGKMVDHRIRLQSKQFLARFQRSGLGSLSPHEYLAGKKFINGLWVETMHQSHIDHDLPSLEKMDKEMMASR